MLNAWFTKHIVDIKGTDWLPKVHEETTSVWLGALFLFLLMLLIGQAYDIGHTLHLLDYLIYQKLLLMFLIFVQMFIR